MENGLYDIELSRWVNQQGFDEHCEFMFLNGERMLLNGNSSRMVERTRDYIPGYVQEMILAPDLFQIRSWIERTYDLYVSVELWRNEWWKGEVPASWSFRVFSRSGGWKEITFPDTTLYDSSMNCLIASIQEAIIHINT